MPRVTGRAEALIVVDVQTAVVSGDQAVPAAGQVLQRIELLVERHEQQARPSSISKTTFAAALAHAGGAQVSEVRITSLTEGTFYAVVQLQRGAGGEPAEVDGRPSDALNLALVTGAPIRVDATLFDHDPADALRTAWKEFPTATHQIAAVL